VVTTNATMLHARNSSTQVRSVITITGLGDHDQPDWLITMTGIRNAGSSYGGRPGVECEGRMLQPRAPLGIAPAVRRWSWVFHRSMDGPWFHFQSLHNI
jgi:hypothetical protein